MNTDVQLPNTRTYAGDDSEGQILGIHFKNFLYMAAALLLSILLLLTVYRQSEGNLRKAAAIGALPLSLTMVHVFVFRQGKPPAYDRDLLETLHRGKAWLPVFTTKTRPNLPHDYAPTGRMVSE